MIKIDRRKKKLYFSLQERRSGFERRLGEQTILDHVAGFFLNTQAFIGLLILINLLNLADYFLTMKLLFIDGVEANPLMAMLFSLNPLFALLVKVFFVAVVCLMFWRYRKFRLVLLSAVFAFVLFVLLIIYSSSLFLMMLMM